MSEFKHTPGPWTALIEGESMWGSDSHSVVAGEHFAGIAGVMIECEASTHGEDGVTHVTQEQGIANARLIAAAPTMHDYITKRADAGDHEAKQILESVNAGS